MRKIHISSLLTLSVFALLLGFLTFFQVRGIIPYDEGWILHPAQRILQGDIPYKDFHYIYTPGSIFLTALFLKIFGQSVLAVRIGAIILTFLTSIVCFYIGKRISPSPFLAIIPVLIFVLWGPLHITFLWPSLLAVCSGIITTFFLFIALEKKEKKYLFLAGIFTMATLLFKQNFGLALFVNDMFFFFFLKEVRKIFSFLSYLSGFFFLFICFYLYLIFTHSFFNFIHDFYFFMVQQIIFKGLEATPFFYPDPFPKFILKSLFYLTPLIISSAALVISMRKRSRLFFLATFPFFYYLLGIRPTTDYTHIAPLIALTGFPFAILLTEIKNIALKTIIVGSVLFVIFLGGYTILIKGYYRWEAPILQHTYFLNNPRIRIFADAHYQYIIPIINNFIEHHTSPNEPIFIYNYSPLFYFMTNRKNPTKYDFLPPSMLSHDIQQEVIHNLEQKNVHLILTDTPVTLEHSLIAEYIRKKYIATYHIDVFTFWVRQTLPSKRS